ncbi:MAG: hypothetical protein ACK5GU_14545 [Chloroflexota bacterium]|jgi:hypothetical protein
MRIVLLHTQLLTTISFATVLVALSAGFDWWRGGTLSNRTIAIRGIWALLMTSEIVIGTIMVVWLRHPLSTPLHLVYGIVALLVTVSVVWVVPRFFVTRQQAQSLAIAMVIVAIVLHRLAITGN